MGTKQSKKLMLFNILDILRKYSDEDHHLSQKEIEKRLKEEYDMTADRKSIKTNLMRLEEFGYDISYSESIRMVKNPKTGELEENYILSDFYLVRDFEDSELRLLIDGLLFSKHLPYSQCKELIEKIEKLSNIYFKSRVKHIATMPKDRTDNKQLFLNIDAIDEAISNKRKISFKYVEYGTDKKQHPKKDSKGKDRVYVVSPYQMAAKEGKYYLICNYDKFDDISNYRVDRIVDIKVLDEGAKPFNKLIGANGQALDLSKYMKEHVYMYSSDTSHAKLRIVNAMVSDVIDMFGTDVRFYDQDETHVSVAVNANEMSVLQFAKNYSPDVVILEPKELRKQAIENLRRGLEAYE